MVIGVPSSPMNMWSVANFDTPPRPDSGCGLSLLFARTQCLHQLLNGRCVNACCSTSASFGSFGNIPGFTGCASSAPSLSCSNPISILMPLLRGFSFADVSASSRYAPFTRSNSILLPEISLNIIPSVLRNVMMMPLSHTCPTDGIDLCSPEFLGAIWNAPDTLIPSLVCKHIVVLPVVVNWCPVADLRSIPSPLDLPPKLSAELCWHTDVAAPESIRKSLLQTGSSHVTEYTHCAESGVATSASSDCSSIQVIGASLVVLAAETAEASKDDASLPGLTLSVQQQSFFMWPQALQRRQYKSRCLVAFPLTLPLPLPFLSLSLPFSPLLLSPFFPLPWPLPFLSPLPFLPYLCPASRGPWVQHHQKRGLSVLDNSQTALFWLARSSSECVISGGNDAALETVPAQVKHISWDLRPALCRTSVRILSRRIHMSRLLRSPEQSIPVVSAVTSTASVLVVDPCCSCRT